MNYGWLKFFSLYHYIFSKYHTLNMYFIIREKNKHSHFLAYTINSFFKEYFPDNTYQKKPFFFIKLVIAFPNHRDPYITKMTNTHFIMHTFVSQPFHILFQMCNFSCKQQWALCDLLKANMWIHSGGVFHPSS